MASDSLPNAAKSGAFEIPAGCDGNHPDFAVV